MYTTYVWVSAHTYLYTCIQYIQYIDRCMRVYTHIHPYNMYLGMYEVRDQNEMSRDQNEMCVSARKHARLHTAHGSHLSYSPSPRCPRCRFLAHASATPMSVGLFCLCIRSLLPQNRPHSTHMRTSGMLTLSVLLCHMNRPYGHMNRPPRHRPYSLYTYYYTYYITFSYNQQSGRRARGQTQDTGP